jgi:hypothetical protein
MFERMLIGIRSKFMLRKSLQSGGSNLTMNGLTLLPNEFVTFAGTRVIMG